MKIWPGIKILDRYIIRKFIGTYLFAIAMIIVVVVLFDYVEKLDDFTEMKAPVQAIIFDYYLNFVPFFINQFSGLFTLNLWVIPVSQRAQVAFEMKYIKKRVREHATVNRHIYRQIEPGVFAYIRGYSAASSQASYLALEHFRNNEMTASLEAADLKIDPATKRWTASRYITREFDSLGMERFEQRRDLDTLINLDVTELGRINELIQTMKIGELNRFLEQQRQKGSDSIRIIEVERHARFVYPISTFILTLIGVSLSSRKVRGGTGLHIGLGVGLCFSYILLMRFFEEFAKSGTLPTGLSMWIPNILYCFIAIYLYKKAPK